MTIQVKKFACDFESTCDNKTDDCKIKLKAKPIIQNKFWIVDNGNESVGTIERLEDGVVYNSGRTRTLFSSLNNLTADLNIVISNANAYKIKKPEPDTGGYPTTGRAYNVLYDVKHRTYIYTKTAKSKSYFCAGYFAIKLNGTWVKQFCPKLISVQRYEFIGPFKTASQVSVNELTHTKV
mgnify:FL=1